MQRLHPSLHARWVNASERLGGAGASCVVVRIWVRQVAQWCSFKRMMWLISMWLLVCNVWYWSYWNASNITKYELTREITSLLWPGTPIRNRLLQLQLKYCLNDGYLFKFWRGADSTSWSRLLLNCTLIGWEVFLICGLPSLICMDKILEIYLSITQCNWTAFPNDHKVESTPL